MVSVADAQRLREAQLGITTLVDRDLDRMWSQVWSLFADGATTPFRIRDAFLAQVPTLVDRYGDMAASVAADWYETQREIEGVAGAFTVELAASVYDAEAVEGTVRRAAGALWTPTPEAMLASLKPVFGKYALDSGRQTIITAADRDPAAAGWQRITRPGACGFCRMLSGRGAVYKRATVHFASHTDCHCGVAPSFDKHAPEVDVDLYAKSRRTTFMTDAQREANNARIRRAVEEYA